MSAHIGLAFSCADPDDWTEPPTEQEISDNVVPTLLANPDFIVELTDSRRRPEIAASFEALVLRWVRDDVEFRRQLCKDLQLRAAAEKALLESTS